MSSSRHDPANRQRPPARGDRSVYRKRRIIALVVLLATIGLVWALIASLVNIVQGFFSGNPAASGAGAVAEGACDPKDITLIAKVMDNQSVERAAFDSGINPFFGYDIANIGSKDCMVDLGAKETYFRVTSGDETIWNSVDCDRSGLMTAPVTLKAGATRFSTPGEWYRVSSSSTGCGAEQTPVVTGGASYHLTVEVGGQISKKTSQFILN
jgi:hypothetical protein